jgi:hypothetical protein
VPADCGRALRLETAAWGRFVRCADAPGARVEGQWLGQIGDSGSDGHQAGPRGRLYKGGLPVTRIAYHGYGWTGRSRAVRSGRADRHSWLQGTSRDGDSTDRFHDQIARITSIFSGGKDGVLRRPHRVPARPVICSSCRRPGRAATRVTQMRRYRVCVKAAIGVPPMTPVMDARGCAGSQRMASMCNVPTPPSGATMLSVP